MKAGLKELLKKVKEERDHEMQAHVEALEVEAAKAVENKKAEEAESEKEWKQDLFFVRQ
mgnify:CR=1 FL=1